MGKKVGIGCLCVVGGLILLSILIAVISAIAGFVAPIFPGLLVLWFLASLYGVFAVRRSAGSSSGKTAAWIASATVSGLLALLVIVSKVNGNYLATQHAHATAQASTAIVGVANTEIAQSVATTTAVAAARARATATAAPHVTATAHAHAIAQKTAAPRETATAKRKAHAQATAAAVAHARHVAAAHAHATAVAIQAVAPWPPRNLSDAQTLANSPYVVSAPVVRREPLSYPDCLCKLYVLMPPGLSPRQQAATLFHIAFANGLSNFSGMGGTVVFGYTSESAMGNTAANAGIVHFDIWADGTRTVSVTTPGGGMHTFNW